ncbi:MAG: hypothetical protein BA874_09580 [Desulfuromonadales bacterium C00003068]|jgi:hypothetical protein|nr:MAG: hypothetical protein BA874_09580 [Desulfuromonadales bacterium C00003068]
MALRRIFRFVLLISLVFVSSVHALEVEDASITTQIVKRAPIDSLNTVPADVDKLYCFTRITGASEDTWVTHVWYCEDKELTRVRLPVNSLNWRTWSSKRVMPQWKGAWRVEVLDNEGQALLIVPFSIF